MNQAKSFAFPFSSQASLLSNIIGCLLLAAVAGGITSSWWVFFVAAGVLVALAISDGDIRLSS